MTSYFMFLVNVHKIWRHIFLQVLNMTSLFLQLLLFHNLYSLVQIIICFVYCFLDYIYFCWARQMIIRFVVCFRTTYFFVGHGKWLFILQSVFRLHVFLLGTTSDYLFRSLFLDYIVFCWARQVIICFVVCFQTTYFFVGHGKW